MREVARARAYDAALDEHVHVVGLNEVQDPLVVGHQNDSLVRPAERIDAICDDLQRIDVEPRVRLVEERQLGVEYGQLEDLVTLLFAARETFVYVALHQVRVEVHRLRLLL